MLKKVTGLSDENLARKQVALKHLNKCKHVVVVANIGRVRDGASVQRDLTRSTRDQRHTGNKMLVITKKDQKESIKLPSYASNSQQADWDGLEVAIIDTIKLKKEAADLEAEADDADESEALELRRRNWSGQKPSSEASSVIYRLRSGTSMSSKT